MNVQLLSVKDLRPIDFVSGKRLAITDEECHVCDRCGKRHVKVYEVLADGHIYNVGSGCCKRLFGWEPAKQDVLEKERIAEEQAMQIALQNAAQEIITKIDTMVAPRPQFKCQQETNFGYVTIYHADGVIVATERNRAGLSPEKRAEFVALWKAAQLEKTLKDFEAEYKANRTQAKRAKQVVQTAKKLAA